MLLMEEFNVEVEDKRVLVIGRSPIVGSPLTHMARQKGAVVTVAHSGVQEEALKKHVGRGCEKLVGDDEVIIT
jgi:methylenetetrahydrofolate dehydrogenase (NADP+)/methenyltetrahydrofolate cyclohydrolase